jgi:uncharacterized glyoxalase superfamily protein PhnB
LLSKKNFQPPPQPVLTRWSKCLKAVEFYNESLDATEETAQALPDTDSAACVALARKIVKDVSIKRDTAYTRCNFAS